MSARRSSTFRNLPLLILLILVVGTGLWCEIRLQGITDTFSQQSSGEVIGMEVCKSLLETLSEQAKLRGSWAIAALAGLFALAVTKQKILPIPWIRSSFILVAMAAVLLVESVHASDLYDRRVAFLILSGEIKVSDIMGLSGLLMSQLDFLYMAIACLGLFVMAFIVATVSGRVDIAEEEKE